MRGKERLAVVFWYYFVLGGIGIALLIAAASASASLVSSRALIVGAGIPLVLFVIAYQLWVLISLWTCAFNVRSRFWGYLTRAYVLALALGFVAEVPESVRWL